MDFVSMFRSVACLIVAASGATFAQVPVPPPPPEHRSKHSSSSRRRCS